MDAEQLELVRAEQKRPRPRTVFAGQFTDQDRTLIYGYTVDRDTFHVYAQGGKLHKFIYRTEATHPRGILNHTLVVVLYEQRQQFEAQELSPSKAIYWDRSNFEFCLKLAILEAYMHFKDSGPAIAERTVVPEFEGAVYDPSIHTTYRVPPTRS